MPLIDPVMVCELAPPMAALPIEITVPEGMVVTMGMLIVTLVPFTPVTTAPGGTLMPVTVEPRGTNPVLGIGTVMTLWPAAEMALVEEVIAATSPKEPLRVGEPMLDVSVPARAMGWLRLTWASTVAPSATMRGLVVPVPMSVAAGTTSVPAPTVVVPV